MQRSAAIGRGGIELRVAHRIALADLPREGYTWTGRKSAADLFKPGSKYLNTIAKFANDELKRENRLLFPEGATAIPENYVTWNIDHRGLLFTFDEYQVGPYAQGPSEVFIPYTTLGDLLQDSYYFAS